MNKKKEIEILAPAGSVERMKALEPEPLQTILKKRNWWKPFTTPICTIKNSI